MISRNNTETTVSYYMNLKTVGWLSNIFIQGRQHDFKSGGPKHSLFLDVIIFLSKRWILGKAVFDTLPSLIIESFH